MGARPARGKRDRQRRSACHPQHAPMRPSGANRYDGTMKAKLSIPEALERAKRVQEDRLTSIQTAVEARQRFADAIADASHRRAALEREIAENLRTFEAADLVAYNAAKSVGWSVNELREIGLVEPAKKPRSRKRAAKKNVIESEPRNDGGTVPSPAPSRTDSAALTAPTTAVIPTI